MIISMIIQIGTLTLILIILPHFDMTHLFHKIIIIMIISNLKKKKKIFSNKV